MASHTPSLSPPPNHPSVSYREKAQVQRAAPGRGRDRQGWGPWGAGELQLPDGPSLGAGEGWRQLPPTPVPKA